MKKLILVESILVGKFSFQGYIVDKGENMIAYSIFLIDSDVVLVELIADANRDVRLLVNMDAFSYINANKTQDKTLRKLYFSEFYNFIIASEKKASYMIFKKKKLNYIKNSSVIIDIKKIYIND
ncbi:hypothetical protein [Sphingobacterium bovistauri]|uniref:Uncharacterized protein n=1 Tax=Sphingobacterium bovistauri TaxID=2781959 RepID=A0ABS7Z3P9_9SPHI|nr:hypothetical protein [Sphingobacterium bovistauri]MCA5004777.1 hypothetical protein [Sphingobacterium bovistauri]